MLKDYEIDKPILETDRLIIRVLNEADVPDLKEGTIRQGKMVSVYCDYNIYGLLEKIIRACNEYKKNTPYNHNFFS